MSYPFIHEIAYQNPVVVFSGLASLEGSVLLESAQLRSHCGRYSFIAVHPFQVLTSQNGVTRLNNQTLDEDPFQALEKQLALFKLEFHPDLPPFQGGAAGFLSYDLCHYLEKLPASEDDRQLAEMAIGFYDLVIAFDHELKRAWIFSSGFPIQEKIAREIHAEKRCQWLLEKIKQHAVLPPLLPQQLMKENIQSNFTAEAYRLAVSKVIDYILSGDIFEANISQRFQASLPENFSSFQLYRQLRLLTPAPFAAYLRFGEMVLVSASPERFLKMSQRHVEARPIKGTTARGMTAGEDQQLASALLNSEKNRAENVMIVDVLRNDLSRVCEDHSVKVPQLCGLESYATVHHLVSVVTGTLQSCYQAVDLLRAAFPCGSVTGAPKVRAMEIIAETEPYRRGPYCGSVGYIGFNGDMDFSVIIRTYVIKNGQITFQVGGAVVLDSDPDEEYQETLLKARALFDALLKVPEPYDFAN